MRVRTLLRSMPLCNALEPDELVTLSSVLTERTFPAGTTLFDEGDHGACCYLQVSGRIGVYRQLPNGANVRLAQTKPGGVVGELALLDHGPRTATAVAEITTVTALQLMRGEFEQLIHARARFAYVLLDGIVRDLAQRLRRSTKHLAAVNADPTRDPTGARLEHAAAAAADLFATHPGMRRNANLDLAGIGATPGPAPAD